MKNKCLVIVFILLFVGTSAILAIAQNSNNFEDEKEPVSKGKIHGCVGNSHGMFTWTPYPFALVNAGNKCVICGPDGQYSMRLLLDHEYNVTAHVIGFKPLTKQTCLTAEEPNKELYFDMCGRELIDSKPFEKSTNSCFIQGTQTNKDKAKEHSNNIVCLDFGWVREPIWGRIDGYEFSGPEKEYLVFYAKNVHYFGIGHYFLAGLYPEHWMNEEVTASYSYFEGIVTKHYIFGRIYVFPD